MDDPSQILSGYERHYFAVPRKSAPLAAKKRFLARTKAVREQIAELTQGIVTIVVTGTNGKGSVTCATAFLLREAGLSVGRITSPALNPDSTDMVLLNGDPIPSNTFAEYLNIASQTAPKGATHYMLICLAAYRYFHDAGCEVIVAETAVGGQFDPTVPISPNLSAFTNIVGDHSEILGDTTTDVSSHKARIIGQGSTVMLGEETSAEARARIQRYANRQNAVVGTVDPPVEQNGITSDGTVYRDTKLEIKDTQRLTPSYQQPNIRLAAALFNEVAGDNDRRIQVDLASCRERFFPPVRFEITEIDGTTFVFDGAHNLDSYQKLLVSTEEIFGNARLAFITGVSNPDNIQAFKDTFGKDRCFFVTGHNPRSLDGPEFTDYDDVNLELLRDTLDADIFVVCDLYLSPNLKRKLLGRD